MICRNTDAPQLLGRLALPKPHNPEVNVRAHNEAVGCGRGADIEDNRLVLRWNARGDWVGGVHGANATAWFIPNADEPKSKRIFPKLNSFAPNGFALRLCVRFFLSVPARPAYGFSIASFIMAVKRATVSGC
jgi:hypothetical protein